LAKNSFSLLETLLALVIVSILATGFTQFASNDDTNTKTLSTSSTTTTFYHAFIQGSNISFIEGSNQLNKTSYEQTALKVYSYSFSNPTSVPKHFEVFE
jgi:Tfp pilus assembly protein PilV